MSNSPISYPKLKSCPACSGAAEFQVYGEKNVHKARIRCTSCMLTSRQYSTAERPAFDDPIFESLAEVWNFRVEEVAGEFARYTLIAYRPDSTVVTPCCGVSHTSSMLGVTNFQDVDKLIECWAQLISAELGLTLKQPPVDFLLLVNGLDEDSWDFPGSPVGPHQALQDRARERGQQLHRERQIAAAKDDREATRVALEKAEYMRLHAIYGQPAGTPAG